MSYHTYPPSPENSSSSNSVVGQINSIGTNGAFVPTGANLIPRSSNATGLKILDAIASDIKAIQVISDIGEFVDIYTDINCTNKIATMVLTPDEKVEINLPAGGELYLRAIKDADIDQAGSIVAMNFLG